MRIEFALLPAYPGATTQDWRVASANGYPTFCCDAMASAWRDRVIRFGAEIITREDDCEVSIWYSHCYPEGAALERFRIDFCPFCGVSIELAKKS